MHSAMIESAESMKSAGKFDEASALFQKLYETGDTNSLIDMGDIYFNQGRGIAQKSDKDTTARAAFRKAATYYLKFAELKPADTMAVYNAAVCYLNAGEGTGLAAIVGRMLARKPYDAELHGMLQTAHYFNKNQNGVVAEKLATDALTQGTMSVGPPKKPLATTDAGKTLARLGPPDRVYSLLQNKIQCSVYFYCSKSELYVFFDDQNVRKSSWAAH